MYGKVREGMLLKRGKEGCKKRRGRYNEGGEGAIKREGRALK
jgi:hypothetical protein